MQLSYKIFSTISGKSVIVSIDEKRYAFNIFDGFQRYCIERQFSMCSIDAVFLPNKYALPGLVGMYLSHSETTRQDLDVISDSLVRLDKIHEFAQVQRIALRLSTAYEDHNIAVVPVTVAGSSNYFIKFRKVNGKFYPERVPAGVPRCLYKLLAEGCPAVFEGQTLDGRDYSDSPIDLGILAIIFSRGDFEELLGHCGGVKAVICTNLEAAKYFVDALANKGATVYYIADSAGVDYDGFYAEQARRNLQDRSFLLPVACGSMPGSWAPDGTSDEYTELEDKVWREQYQQRYFRGITLKTDSTVNFSRVRGFSVVQSIPKNYLPNKSQSVVPGITFLGTGCSQPSKYRNVSAVLYETADNAVLLDCGEDTLAQILRVRGSLRVLDKLKIIYLSHSHADHMLGVAGVLRHLKHKVLIVGPSACRGFIEGFYEKDNGESVGHTYVDTSEAKRLEGEFYREENRTWGRGWLQADADTVASVIGRINISRCTQLVEMGGLELRVVGCCHSLDSTSVVLVDMQTGRRIAYSGDTLPSVLFTALACGADVMVHEASFTAEQLDRARKTNHSTDAEARRVFEYSKAKRLILTHFSNRNMNITVDAVCAADFYRLQFED